MPRQTPSKVETDSGFIGQPQPTRLYRLRQFAARGMKVKGGGRPQGVKRQGEHAIIAGRRGDENNQWAFGGNGDLVQEYDAAI